MSRQDNSMNEKQNHDPITRREFARIASAFGLSSTLLSLSGFAALGLAPTSEALAESAAETQKKRYRKQAKVNWKLGTSQSPETLLKTRMGTLVFISDIEERTDGEIRVEFMGSNQLCDEISCVEKCQEGSIDLFTTTTQNASHKAPYLNVLDFAYLWPSRAAQYHFFYHPKSEALFREPLRKFHKLQFLFTHCELRGIMMGLKYKDQPKIMTLDKLKGTKLRVTETQLGRIAMKLLGTNPVQVAWKDTLNALQKGLIDGAETFSSACAHSMVKSVSQDIHCGFFSGNAHTSMNINSFEKLSPDLREQVMESAYFTQVHVQTSNEAALNSLIGITDPPLPGTEYEKYGVRNCWWPTEELEKAERMSSPRYNPQPWEKWSTLLNKMAGGVDIFNELYRIAGEIPLQTPAINVEPRRWWKG